MREHISSSQQQQQSRMQRQSDEKAAPHRGTEGTQNEQTVETL